MTPAKLRILVSGLLVLCLCLLGAWIAHYLKLEQQAKAEVTRVNALPVLTDWEAKVLRDGYATLDAEHRRSADARLAKYEKWAKNEGEWSQERINAFMREEKASDFRWWKQRLNAVFSNLRAVDDDGGGWYAEADRLAPGGGDAMRRLEACQLYICYKLGHKPAAMDALRANLEREGQATVLAMGLPWSDNLYAEWKTIVLAEMSETKPTNAR